MSGLTKILIVLQLIFSIALSVVVVMMVSKQENYKDQLDSLRAGAVSSGATIAGKEAEIAGARQLAADESRKRIEAQTAANVTATAQNEKINKLTSDTAKLQLDNAVQAAQIRSLEITVNSQQANNAALSTQVAEMSPKTNKLIAENAQINRQNAEQSTALRGAEETIRRLQEQLAQYASQSPTTGATGAESQRIVTATGLQTPVQINGQITDIAQSAGRTLIETKLGTRDGVKAQTRLAIYRGNSYVGDAVVTTVTVDSSVAVVMMVKPGETVHKGDLVMSGLSGN